MAVRMQQRRATAEQWLLADPVLAEGEIGLETDTQSFKIGDGVNNWSLLDYFETSTSLQATIDDYIPLTEKGAPLGVAELDANGFVPSAQLDIDLTAYYTSAQTDSAVSTAVANLVDTAPTTLDTLNELAAALGDDPNFATTVTSSIAEKAPLTQTLEAKTGAYTLVAADRGKLITGNGTFTITIPGSVFSAGDRVDFVNIGTGVITFAGSSLTLNSKDAAVTIDSQYAGATILFESPTVAYLIGAIA